MERDEQKNNVDSEQQKVRTTTTKIETIIIKLVNFDWNSMNKLIYCSWSTLND